MLELSVIDNLEQHEQTGSPLQENQELDADTLLRYANEVRFQPAWRKEADKCADYYAGNQIDPDLMAELQLKNLGPLITNLIAPTVNIILGQEAKSRSDWRVIADSDEYSQVAEAQASKLFEAERESRADRACSDAYASQVISGLGWVEAGREQNPFRYPYRCGAIHRREMSWDWRAKQPDLYDAKYIFRKRWYDIAEACTFFPGAADVIRASGSGWPAFWLERAKEDVQLMNAFEQERRISMEDWEWRNLNSRTVAITEVWYRIYVRGLVLELPDRTVEFDMNNPLHVAAVSSGKMWPKAAVYSKLRRSFWIGGHKMADDDYGVTKLPYVPFWGYREDLTGVPYGVVRSMISPQDEVNARRRKLLWQLSAKRVQIDSDALDTAYNDFSDVVREVSRPDAVVVLNPHRRNAAGFAVDHNAGLSEQQYKVMEESKQALQEVAGVFNAQLGRDSSATSGLAINSLVEQGNIALAEINDNYRFARRMVGELLLDLIIEDMRGKQVDVVVGEAGAKRKVISLNVPKQDEETGMTYYHNDVSKARTKVALEDVPSTPAYRAQMQVMLAEIIKSLPPQLQAVMAPYFIESTELQKRHEIADVMRKQLGLPTDGEEEAPEDPRIAQMTQQIQEMQAYIQQGTASYQEMQQKVIELSQALKNKQDEIALKRDELSWTREKEAQELLLKEREVDSKVETEAIKADAEKHRVDVEERIAQGEIGTRMEEARHTREASILSAPEPEKAPERDESAEKEQIKNLIVEAIEPIQKQLEAMVAKKEEKPSPAPEPKEIKPPVVNVTIGGKKKITVQRDDKGNIVGADVDESES